MLKRKRLTALLLTLCLVFTLMPTTAFAEAGNWNPTTPRTEVQGKNVGFQYSRPSSTTLKVGNTGYLRMMPTLSIGSSEYNAMAYCDAKAVSKNDDVVSVNKITTGKWKGGIWDNADCLQVNVTPHKAGTAQVIVSYYYTFSQNPTPFNNPKTRWLNTEVTWTIKVTGEPGNFTVTYTDGVEGAEIFADEVYKNLRSGDRTPAFKGNLTREGYDFTGWTPALQETVSATTVYIATWKEKPTTVPEIKNVPIKFMDGTKVVAERYVTVTDQGEPVVLRAADLAVLLNNKDYELFDKEQSVTVEFDNAEVRVQVKKIPTPEDKTIIVNYVTEDGKNVLTSSIDVPQEATSVNTGLLKDAIYGYEIAVVGDIAIENGAINVTVRERVYTKTVTVNYVTENGENVLTSSIVVSKDATSVNTGLLKDAIYGYEIAVVGDIAIKDGAINVVVREKKQPEEPDNPPHHHGGGSSRSDKITITFMPADGYTLDAQKGTSLRKDGSVSMYISSGIVPEKMIPNAVRADKFYKVTGWAVKDRKGNLEEINLDTYRFKRNTEVYALYDDVWTPYKDMKADRSDWYYKELRDLSISGIVGGYRDGSYHAEAQVTWGAALKLIELAAGNPEQAQIPGTNHACSGYLALAKAKGHVAADAVIDLHRPITRLEFSQVAAKALDLKASHKASPFTDTDDAEVVALNEAGIINGYGNGQFGPKDVIKRSHIAAIIWRINQYQAK